MLAEVQALVDAGAIEVTLLGQNVNSYGVEFGDRGAFAKLLRACGTVEGLERVRFTSPHPAAFTDDVIEAMAATPTVMPQLHMPLQSGSDRVLRAMRRSYRSDRFLGILDRVRAAMPDAAITTDIIVGFPGETEEDFAETLRVVEASRFASAFTFQYSPRPGTPAADLPDQLPKAVVQERYERLQALQERISLEENAAQTGRVVEVLVADVDGRKDGASLRVSGRAADNRLVHFALPPDRRRRRALADAGRRDARPADPRRRRPAPAAARRPRHGGGHPRRPAPPGRGLGARRRPYAVRRTRAGDAWAPRARARPGRRRRARARPARGARAAPVARWRCRSCSACRRSAGRPRPQCPARPAAATSSRRAATASSAVNICTPVPRPHAMGCASWVDVTPFSRSTDTSLYRASSPSSSRT